jgi:hypothetical protein
MVEKIIFKNGKEIVVDMGKKRNLKPETKQPRKTPEPYGHAIGFSRQTREKTTIKENHGIGSKEKLVLSPLQRMLKAKTQERVRRQMEKKRKNKLEE